MSKVEIDYIQRWFDKRLRRERIVFRKAGQKRITLPGSIGSPEFWRAYEEALALTNKLNAGEALRSKPGSVSAAVASYYTSRDWAKLSEGTRGMRRRQLERFRQPYGEFPLGKLNQTFLVTYLGDMSPHAACSMLKTLRGFLRHAGHDVTRGMTPIKAKSTKRPSWPAEAIAQYEAHHPIESKARLAFALAKYTGAGRSEIARMGPRHVRDGEIVIARQKTGVEACIPIHPELQAILDATPVTGLGTFLISKTGRPYSANDLSEQFRAWCNEAHLPETLSLHGLRHAMGDALAEAGASAHEVASVLGHGTVRSALHYTQQADRKRMARRAMQRLIGTKEG